MPFDFGVLVEDRRSENFPDFGERFFFSELLFVFKISDIESNIANDAEVEKSASISSLKIFVIFAFGVKWGVSAEATPHIESFGIIGNDGQPKARNVKHTFNNFVAIDGCKFSFGIVRSDMQNVSSAKHGIAGYKKSDDSIVNTAVKCGEYSTSNNIVAVNDGFVVKLSDTAKIFRFANGNNANMFPDRESVVPSAIADFIFRRKDSIGSNDVFFIES